MCVGTLVVGFLDLEHCLLKRKFISTTFTSSQIYMYSDYPIYLLHSIKSFLALKGNGTSSLLNNENLHYKEWVKYEYLLWCWY